MLNGAVLFRTRPHPIVLVGYFLLALVFQVALILIAAHVPQALVVFGPIFVLAVLSLDYFATVYEATTESVVKRQGFLWRREELIPLPEIQDLKFRTGILGQLLGFGTLEIESAGTAGKVVLDALPMWAYRLLRPLRRSLLRQQG